VQQQSRIVTTFVEQSIEQALGKQDQRAEESQRAVLVDALADLKLFVRSELSVLPASADVFSAFSRLTGLLDSLVSFVSGEFPKMHKQSLVTVLMQVLKVSEVLDLFCDVDLSSKDASEVESICVRSLSELDSEIRSLQDKLTFRSSEVRALEAHIADLEAKLLEVATSIDAPPTISFGDPSWRLQGTDARSENI
jgi:polyhydroxyalkanoate synthesis regulator phasin